MADGFGYLEVDPFKLVAAIDGLAGTGAAFKEATGPYLCPPVGLAAMAGTDPIGSRYLELRGQAEQDVGVVLNRICNDLTIEFPAAARGAALEFLRQDMAAAAGSGPAGDEGAPPA